MIEVHRYIDKTVYKIMNQSINLVILLKRVQKKYLAK